MACENVESRALSQVEDAVAASSSKSCSVTFDLLSSCKTRNGGNWSFSLTAVIRIASQPARQSQVPATHLSAVISSRKKGSRLEWSVVGREHCLLQHRGIPSTLFPSSF